MVCKIGKVGKVSKVGSVGSIGKKRYVGKVGKAGKKDKVDTQRLTNRRPDQPDKRFLPCLLTCPSYLIHLTYLTYPTLTAFLPHQPPAKCFGNRKCIWSLPVAATRNGIKVLEPAKSHFPLNVPVQIKVEWFHCSKKVTLGY